MASANEILLNESIAHQIDLQGYSNNVVGKIIALLDRTDADLVTQLRIAMEKMPVSQFNVERLAILLQAVNDLNKQAYADVSTELNKELKELTAYELGYQQQLLSSVLPEQAALTTVTAEQVFAAALARPFQGKLLAEWMAGLEQTRAVAIRDAVRIGYVESQTIDQVVKRIRGTKALNYADGLLDISRRNATAIVRTALNHTANYAHEALVDANGDIVKGVRYTATLDLRTTVLCASRDGNVYALGKPKPSIPAHMNCRSRYVMVLKSFRELGIPIGEIPASTRASLDGQVPASTTYQEWLSKQSVARQNDVLGETKAKLFREGGLDLPKFVSKQGHVFTLDELRARDAEAFKKAGL